MAYAAYGPNEVAGDSGGSGSGSVLSDIFASITSLGTAAIISSNQPTYSPMNSGYATNPYGQRVMGAPMTQPGSSSIISLLLVGVLVIVAIFAFKRL
jgi:hypothetical protein